MKKRVLCWSDSASTATGFGVVTKNILSALHATDLYEIEHIAINYHGDFVNKDEFPWQMVPAKTQDPNDPYGNRMFLNAIQKRQYDIIWVMNDTFVVEEVAKTMEQIFTQSEQQGRELPILVYYYPVDCRVMVQASTMLRLADVAVAYTEFGIVETQKSLPQLTNIKKIYHGTNTDVFKPLPLAQIQEARMRNFHINGDTTLIINVNRNSQRKQLATTILAFQEFRKTHPNSMLYLHTNIVDQMSRIDLQPLLDQLGMSTARDVIFPTNYSPAYGLPENAMNLLYNCADMFVTTHLGEGWGLSVTEAMAAGTPVVAPDNTSMPEIVGADRGWLYPCREKLYVDNSGWRAAGRVEDIVTKMLQVKDSGWKFNTPQVLKARSWTMRNSWTVITKQWIDLFANLQKKPKAVAAMGEVV